MMDNSIVKLFIFVIFVNLVISATVRVKTEYGDVEGITAKSLFGKRNYYSFKGIPYAKPPIDDLRLKVNFKIKIKVKVNIF